jgi:hypothetical protein
VLDELKGFVEELKSFRAEIKTVSLDRVNPIGLRNTAEQIGSHWCVDLGPRLKITEGFEAGLTEKYTTQFERLIKLTASNKLKSSYMSVLDAVPKESLHRSLCDDCLA